jgi:hypothetical protein
MVLVASPSSGSKRKRDRDVSVPVVMSGDSFIALLKSLRPAIRPRIAPRDDEEDDGSDSKEKHKAANERGGQEQRKGGDAKKEEKPKFHARATIPWAPAARSRLALGVNECARCLGNPHAAKILCCAQHPHLSQPLLCARIQYSCRG